MGKRALPRMRMPTELVADVVSAFYDGLSFDAMRRRFRSPWRVGGWRDRHMVLGHHQLRDWLLAGIPSDGSRFIRDAQTLMEKARELACRTPRIGLTDKLAHTLTASNGRPVRIPGTRKAVRSFVIGGR